MMRREDLWVKCTTPGGSAFHRCTDGWEPVSDAELAELIESMGYVKREVAYPNQGGDEMWISDSDGGFRVSDEIGPFDTVRSLVVGDLERMGYVKVPDCEECDGTGALASPILRSTYTEPCPSCGGTGKQRMYAVDGPPINWDIMREIQKVVKDFGTPWALEHFMKVMDGLNEVAALEGETDE